MLETSSAAAPKAVRQQGIKYLRWLNLLPPGAWVALGVVLLMGGRLLWVHAGRPAHQPEITAAFGSVHLFFGAPQANHDGSRLTYIGSAEKRCALFQFDTLTGRSQKIVETDTVGWEGNLDFRAGPWAPDDSAFIYFLHDQLVVCPTDASRTSSSLTVGRNAVSEVTWLNPREFAYMKAGTINLARESSAGQWELHPLPHQEGVSCLTAVSSNTVAWLQGGLICRLNTDEFLAGMNDPFSSPPRDLPSAPPPGGLTLWLDAATLQQSNQTPVTKLADLSPQKNLAVFNQNPPSYNAADSPDALNGKGTIHFQSGAAITNATGLKTIRNLGIKGAEPRTVFVVMRRAAKGNWMLINLGQPGKNGAYFGINDQFNFTYLPAGWGGDNAVPPAATWRILEVVYDGIHQRGYVNGALSATATFAYDTGEKAVEIGLRTGGAKGEYAAGSDGDFAELLVYNRALETAERQQVENYLAQKWFGGKVIIPQNLVWLDPQIAGLSGFSFSPATGQLLLSRAAGGPLWRFNPQATGTNQLTEIPGSSLLRGPQWAGRENFASLSSQPGHRGVVVTDTSGTEQAQLLGRGWVINLTVPSDGNRMFILGTSSNEPAPGIWQYDLASKQLSLAVPGSEHSSAYARNNFPSSGWLKLPSGRGVLCFLYPPLNFDPHKKYPLVILNTTYLVRQNGEPEQQWIRAVAACGAYVVIINRDDWRAGIEQWGENVLGIYQNLIHDPSIDASRVYLAGSSLETHYLNTFITQHPGLWRGVALIGPVGLPDLTKAPAGQKRPRILIEDASQGMGNKRLKAFQQDALNCGVLVDLFVQPDEGHRIVGNTARLERTRNLINFIFEE